MIESCFVRIMVEHTNECWAERVFLFDSEAFSIMQAYWFDTPLVLELDLDSKRQFQRISA